jgi:uncharacterized alpha-E superfamily protein
MLSRVADHLYWMSRYLERAENMARILDVGQSLALVSRGRDAAVSAMEPLVITDTVAAFRDTGATIGPEQVARFLAWDARHPSSILNCLEGARENARAVRGSITAEMWENINDTWLQLQQRQRQVAGPMPVDAPFFDWVRERSHMFRGITDATIRQDQPNLFIRLGIFIERADNTARILSVKQADPSGGEDSRDATGDYYSLSAVLRSVSAFEAYRDTYRDAIDARRVAELLIFDPRLPRSLRYCVDQVHAVLHELPERSGRLARRLAAILRSRLAYGVIDEVHDYGLAAWLERFLRDNVRLGEALHAAYLELK